MEYRDDYSGVLTAVPYVFRRARSRLFKAYVVVAALVTVLVAVFVATGLVRVLAESAAAGPLDRLGSRALFVLLGVAVVLPALAPVLFVARRHRRGDPTTRYEVETALTGFFFLVSVYILLVATTPRDLRQDAGAASALYAIPTPVAVAVVLAAAALVYVVGRYR